MKIGSTQVKINCMVLTTNLGVLSNRLQYMSSDCSGLTLKGEAYVTRLER